MADIIAMFSRLAKLNLSALLELSGRGSLSSSLDGSSSSSLEATRCSALDDFERIIQMLPRIEVVLQDVEEWEIQDRSVKLWLSELRLLAYDIDDVVDEYDYDLLTAQMKAKATEELYHLGKRKRGDDEHHDKVEKSEVRNILTSSSSEVLAFSDGMAEKQRETKKRLDEIERHRNVLRYYVRKSAQNRRLTSSLVNKSSIIRRLSAKKKIVKSLLLDSVSDKITVIPIATQVTGIFDGIGKKLREIRERFDKIERDGKELYLILLVKRTISAEYPRLTSSLVDESNIIGRKSEKEAIVKLLLSDFEFNGNIPVSNKITVIPIVGMGGVGKTTLAQLIYNDPRIRQYFDLCIWIYVSEDFDLMKLTKQIYRSITHKSCEEDLGLDYLQDSIKKKLMKLKRTFLVLDDVWNEKKCLWESLQVPFHGAGIVNILLTTRNTKVADIMRTMNIFYLGMFSENEGLQLFQQHALCNHDNLMRIGQGIVNKCGGLPLAIKLLGSHLRFETDEDKWMSILESEIWDLDPRSSEIFCALRLSYEKMPSHLKPCFRYCSIFPKDKMPDKNHLIWLWMAQGYIQHNIMSKTMEEIGREYFNELLERSLFQVTKNTDYFKMHDLVYELAVFISSNEFITIKLEGGNQNKCISNNVRHLAIYDQSTNNGALKDNLVLPFLTRHVALRSLFYYGKSIIDDFPLSDSKRLRAMHIDIIVSNSQFSKILGSNASLKHLRYIYLRKLNTFGFSHFEKDFVSSLFKSLHSSHNVQVLELSGFYEPIMLPKGIKNLISLRHLILPYGSIMPCGISKLTSLQTLKFVDIKDGNHDGGGLDEIEDLESLAGSCCIEGIDYAHNVEDFKKANINRKKHIWRLCIYWHNIRHHSSSFDVHISFTETIRVVKQSFEMEEVKLEALRPHNSLKELGIYNYPGIQFPWWLGDPSYSKLQVITLQGCNEWDGSGRVLDRDLSCLQSISIIDCAKLKTIKVIQSSSLSRLLIKQCPKITTLHGLCSLHRLERLEIIKCHNLLISAEVILPSKLQYVWFEDCWELTSITGLQNLHSLKELKLKRCSKLKLSLEEQLLSIPRVLEIVDCPGLEDWCQRYGFKIIQDLSKMEELTIRHIKTIISHYGSDKFEFLKTLHLLEFEEIDFPKDEWIPRNLHTLHLNSCQKLMFFPPYKNLSSLKLLKIWRCMALTCLHGLEKMESLEKLEIIECPQFALSPNDSLPPKLQFLFICNCPSLLCLPGLEQLFFLRNLKLFECSELMLPPPEQLPSIFEVQLELFNSPKLIDWCQRYDIRYTKKEFPKEIFVRSSEHNKLWHEEDIFSENICVLDYDGAILETEKWLAFRLMGFYICSCDHLESISLWKNFTRLKQLRIWDCPQLEELFGLQYVTTLQNMEISNCPNLFFLDHFPNSLQYLAIDRCNMLDSLNCWEINISSLEICSCSSLIYLRRLQNLASLYFLKIYNCPELCLDDELLPDRLNPNNVEISACPQLQEWCQKQDVAYYTEEG